VVTVLVGQAPVGVAVRHDGARAYVSNSNYPSNSVTMIDISSDSVVATLMMGTGPKGIAVNRANTRVYIADNPSNTVSGIDTTG
jgi:YVTN family beta-propeller protein